MTESVSVLVPWREEADPYRRWAWRWVQERYEAAHPDWELVTGACEDGPFNRAAAILDAARAASGDVFVVADADVWVDPQPAVDHVGEYGWAIPHKLVYRLSQDSTDKVFDGADWRGLPLSTDNPQDSRPYVGHETGTMFVIQRDVLFDVPPDVRFVGWGSEDDAHACALRCLVGTAWRGEADLVHCWHEPQPRMTRVVGNESNKALLARYREARRSRASMLALLDEVNDAATSVSS